MNLAIVLVHNKSDQENEAQIEELLNRLTEVRLPLFEEDKPVLNDEGIQKTYFSHYLLDGLNIEHVVSVYQIVPFQPDNTSEPYEAVRPLNFNRLNSHNVLYGRGDEDKLGDHPRFFNWGLKRSTDYGADVVLNVEDVSKLNIKELNSQLLQLTDRQDKTEFIEAESGILATAKVLKEVGQLDESITKEEAIIALKNDIEVVGKEVKNG